jgi:uncharacterized LabA/DUF88 family protein
VAEAESRGQHHVAVLLDFENLVIAFKQRGGDAARRVRVEPIVDFLEDNFGNVIFRRAYADWAHPDFTHHQKELQALGVEMIHVPRRTRSSKKNGADILLTADAVESLLLRPFIDTFAVVSGDSDIGPLVTKLKAHGKNVVVIGPDARSTARHVIELADRFKYYDDIVAPVEPTPKRKRARRPQTPERAVVELLRGAAGERIESADLKRRLLAMPPFKEFQEKALGFKTWTSFLDSIDEVEVHRRSDLGVEVGLRER